MKAMQISINGKQRCVIGVGDKGVLSTIINWIDTPNDARGNRSEYGVSAGGLVIRPNGKRSHYRWLIRRLKVGDEVTVRLLEAEKVDKPKVIRLKTSLKP